METINILCATDNNYAPYCGIMLTSVFDSNRDCHFNVYVLTDGSLSEKNIRKFGRLGEKYANTITLKSVDNKLVADFPINSKLHISQATYYRLFAPYLLSNISRCIYFDSDIVICGDIKPLWKIDLTGKAFIGAKDSQSEICCRRLDYQSEFGYLNAGVCVFNLDFWRNNNLSEQLCEYISDNKEIIPYMDQDALNGLLHEQMAEFPERYNFQQKFFLKQCWNDYTESYQRHLLDEVDNASVIHYCGKLKPWNFHYYGGFQHILWEKYRKKSLWRNCRNKKPFVKFVKHLIKRYLFSNVIKRQLSAKWVVLSQNN